MDAAGRSGGGVANGDAGHARRHAVAATEEGRRAYEELVHHSTRWRDYLQSLSGTSPHAPWLVEDLFYALYQAEVVLNPDVDPELHRNFGAVAALLPMTDFARLRRETTGDAVASGLAAQRLADRVLAAATGGGGRQRVSAGVAWWGLVWRRSRKAEEASQRRPTMPWRAVADAADDAARDRQVRAVWGIEPGVRSARALDGVWEQLDLVRNLPDFAQVTAAFAELTAFIGPTAGQRGRRQQRRREGLRFEKLLGLTPGRDLARVVPEELVRLHDEDMAGLFYEAFAHGRLIMERYGRQVPEAPGPLVVALDASRSMNTPAARGWQRSVWAKGVGLALMDTARRTARPFLGLCFSSETDLASFSMPVGGYTPELAVALAQCDFDGGTHFQAPLRRAVEYLEEQRGLGPDGDRFMGTGLGGGPGPENRWGPGVGRGGVDGAHGPRQGVGRRQGPGHIVFVTDGEAALPTAFVQWFQQARRRLGFRLFTIFIDGGQQELVDLSDRVFAVRGGRLQSWEQTAAGLARALGSFS